MNGYVVCILLSVAIFALTFFVPKGAFRYFMYFEAGCVFAMGINGLIQGGGL